MPMEVGAGESGKNLNKIIQTIEKNQLKLYTK